MNKAMKQFLLSFSNSNVKNKLLQQFKSDGGKYDILWQCAAIYITIFTIFVVAVTFVSVQRTLQAN
jgi:hypothetical protein